MELMTGRSSPASRISRPLTEERLGVLVVDGA
jgi:hypothetical protein